MKNTILILSAIFITGIIALIELPKYMPRTTVTANANGIFKTVEARMARARFSKDRAK